VEIVKKSKKEFDSEEKELIMLFILIVKLVVGINPTGITLIT
jgi:hypothetical protein